MIDWSCPLGRHVGECWRDMSRSLLYVIQYRTCQIGCPHPVAAVKNSDIHKRSRPRVT